MPSPEILKDLLEKVRKADAGSNELDGTIWNNLCSWKQTVSPEHIVSQKYVHAACDNPAMVRYSQSLDACLSLLGEVLPGANCHGYTTEWHKGVVSYEAYVSRNHVKRGDHWYSEFIGTTPAIAMLGAILSALLSQHSIKE